MGLTVYGGGGKPEEEKTVTAGTSVIKVLPSSGKTMKKVNVNPTPTEEKTITAGTSATTVTPTSGKYIKKVTVNPTPSQSKTVTPSTSQQTVSPDSGKLLSQVIVKAMEDVTPEVTAQTPVITQIAENLGVTITTPSGTNKQILQGNNANLLNIKNNAKKEGLYVWKKLTADGGTFVDYVVDNNESKYPDGGTQGGYWYEKVVEGVAGIDFGEVTLSGSHEGNLVVTHNLGVKPSKAFIFLRRNSIGCGSPGNYTAGADSTGAYQNYSFTGDKDWLYRTQQSHIMAASTVTFKQATTYWSFGTYDWVVIK